jgi:hypothetical protein
MAKNCYQAQMHQSVEFFCGFEDRSERRQRERFLLLLWSIIAIKVDEKKMGTDTDSAASCCAAAAVVVPLHLCEGSM